MIVTDDLQKAKKAKNETKHENKVELICCRRSTSIENYKLRLVRVLHAESAKLKPDEVE